MNALDYVVLLTTILGIAIYGTWQTRNRSDLNSYVRGKGQVPWFAIGLSVMATQASAITFLSAPGQGFLGGLSFIQVYFGVPIAIIVIAMYFLPLFRRMNVYTAYEYLENRFDVKMRALGAGLFLLQRGLGAGLTIYAPAIVMTSVFRWPLDVTVIGCGILVIAYTVLGGSDAVTITQKYQMAIIFAGMATATWMLIGKLPPSMTPVDALTLAGTFKKLNAVSFSLNPNDRYTIWSGILGGTFLMLSYFGTDQSQVQRYISGTSVRESRLGLLFHAVCKIPMQFCILSIGVLMFLFYQFQPAPLFFDKASCNYVKEHQTAKMVAYQNEFATAHTTVGNQLSNWLTARHSGERDRAERALQAASIAQQEEDQVRVLAAKEVTAKESGAKANDADYIFITFIMQQLPHGVIGLLVAAFFAAALSSKAAELNALGATTSLDIFRLIKRNATDSQCLVAAKAFTAFWGLVAVGFALFAHLSENLIQAVNIVGSIFYGVMLAIFLVAFFVRRVGGTAMFWSSIVAQALIFVLYFNMTISYLWYPLIGCAACVLLSIALQAVLGSDRNALDNKEYAS